MFTININSLGVDPETLDVQFEARELNPGLESLNIIGKTHVHASIQRMAEKVLIRGTVQAKSQLACSRCLKDFEESLEAKLMLLAVPEVLPQAGQDEQNDIDYEISAEDAIAVPYHGEQIDLLPEICAALILAVPMKPLCHIQCPGLCPYCAKPLLNGPCDCKPEQGDGPFSVLKKWKV